MRETRRCASEETGEAEETGRAPVPVPPAWDTPLRQSPSGMTPRRWGECMARYVAGAPIADLVVEYRVSRSAIHWHAKHDGMRKADHPDAVRLNKGPAPLTVEMGVEGEARIVRGAEAFVLDRDDPDATVRMLLDQAEEAAREGRDADYVRRLRMVEITRRVLDGGARGKPGARAVAEPEAWVQADTLTLRESQTPPDALPDGGDWSTWLFLGGRGAGKTLAGASWLADQAEALGQGGRLALIGPTLHDVREVMIEGVSGIRSLPRWTADSRPVFESSRRRLVFENGCIAHAFSAEDPDSLRGPQFSAAWADEFCAWPGAGARGAAETLALARMGLRLRGVDGASPRLVVTTTPRPTRALIALRDEPTCVLTHAGTSENAAHLSPGFLEGLRILYGGTRREAQELEGRVVDLDGALFTAEILARAGSPAPSWEGTIGDSRSGRARTAPFTDGEGGERPHPGSASGSPVPPHEGAGEPAPRPYEKIIVAIDPTTTATGDACGIVVAASRLRPDGVREAVVLADRSKAGLSPDGWARRAVRAAADFGARAIVAEVNQGGEMVKQVLRTAGCDLRVREVRATKGKRVRAEPVAALYEQGRVLHRPADGVRFDALEEELMAFGADGEDTGSLDRADALVWAITDLLIDAPNGERGPGIRWL